MLLIFIVITFCQAGQIKPYRCPGGSVFVAGGCVQCLVPHCQMCSIQDKCDICKPGFYKRSSAYLEECTKCYPGCIQCLSWDKCQTCKDGYVLSNGLCQECTANCQICSRQDTCDKCNQGYYVTSLSPIGLCETCPNNCMSCRHKHACISCALGYHGTICTEQCSLWCRDRQCRQADGICEYGCVSGYYTDNNLCNRCPHGCSSCTASNKCDSCNDGFYLSNNNCVECPENCETCDNSNLYCDTCKTGYYGYGCHLNCSDNCYNKKCNQSNGVCSNGCVAGFYGYMCDQPCSTECRNKACYQQNGRCRNGCIEGYYGDRCLRCSELCLNQECSASDGRCTKGCVDGYYKDRDQCYKCPANCKSCSTSYQCTSCTAGFYGPNCNTSCLHCMSGGCSLQEGVCTNGCQDGFYQKGIRCFRCPGNCSKCQASHCEECKSGYFGNMCKRQCPLNCLACDDIGSCSTCMMKTGECLNCSHNTFGRFCDFSCSANCLMTSSEASRCFQENGTCRHGCVDGFTGIKCTEENPTSKLPSLVAAIMGSCLGSVLLVTGVIALILLIRRSRKQRTVSTRVVTFDSQHARCTIRNFTFNASIGSDTIVSSETNTDSTDHVYALIQDEASLHQEPTFEINQRVADISMGNPQDYEGTYDVASSK